MSEEGGHGFGGVPSAIDTGHVSGHKKPESNITAVNSEDYPVSPRGLTMPNPFSRANTSMDLDDYFSGPRDIAKHSKWPFFMQMHGSILPKMIVPLIVVGCWSTLIYLLSNLVPGVDLRVDSVLLTVTGFVVALGLSFRSSTAYERYAEGRRFWAQLALTSQQLARVFWVHATEREDMTKQDMLSKLTAMNLVVAFAVSLKHKLRFEPYTYYNDLTDLIDHLDTFAKGATDENDVFKPKEPNWFKRVGESLGISFAASNPRKAIKKAQAPLGNLPLEILCYLSAYTDELVIDGRLPIPMTQTLAYNGMASLNEVLIHTERVLTTPLPIAYTIAFSQITWVYVFLLPFQLLKTLDYITIPASIAAAYIILGILFIGREIENPFGNDVNDLPLELYCAQIVQDMETVASRPKARTSDWVESKQNKVLFPHSESNYQVWMSRPETALRSALRNRPHNGFDKGPNEKGEHNV